jgi:hypothetical protein
MPDRVTITLSGEGQTLYSVTVEIPSGLYGKTDFIPVEIIKQEISSSISNQFARGRGHYLREVAEEVMDLAITHGKSSMIGIKLEKEVTGDY